MIAPATTSSAHEPAVERIEPVERRARVPRWVGVVFPLAILGGVGLVLVARVNQTWLDFVVAIAGSAGLGLVLGLAARRSLPHRSTLVRWLVAMGALIVSLSLAGILSGGVMGLSPLLPLAPAVRWAEILQLLAGGLASWLAVRAFPRPSLPVADPAADGSDPNWGFTYHPTISDTQPIRSRRPSAALRTSSPGPRAPAALLSTQLRASPSASLRTGPLRRSYDRLVARLARASAWRPTLGLLPASRRSSPIRFTGAAEDRCPYCLDIVDEHDPRGVTTCPVCHTRHHTECWAVTGTCQMPHLYAGGGTHRPGAAR
jgi:hypothetical protein